PFWSFQLSFMGWPTWVLDAALYPPLVASFVGTLFVRQPSHWLRWILCLAIIWTCTWLNIRGVSLVGRFSVLMTALMMAPVVIMIVLGWWHASLSSLIPIFPPDGSRYGALNYALIWALWSYSGYGAMARDGVLPRGLERLHPGFGTPARVLILQAVVYSVLTFFFGFVELLVVSTWLALPSYILQFASPVVLRLKRPDLRGSFRIPRGLPVLLWVAAVPSLIALDALFAIARPHLLLRLGFVDAVP